MDNNFGFHQEIKEPEKKNSGFSKGVVVGILSASVLMIFVVCIAVLSLFMTGHIHLGINGEIYVQDVSTSSEEGIGSDVEEKLNTLDSLLDGFYFDDVDKEKAINNILKAYVSAYGDKYTIYYTPEEYKSVMETTTGKFYGIGVTCQKEEDGSIKCVEVFNDSPAQKAGIKNDDRIIKVNGEDITTEDLSVAVGKIKGDKGTDVNLTVLRGEQTLEITVTRDEVIIQTVSYEMKEGSIGYIKVSQFEGTTFEQFKNAINNLKNQGMKSLIIDVRDNPGGEVNTVINMLEYILPDGLYMYYETKDGTRKEYSGKDNNELNVPLAVLVNGNSASASEIFAAAIQDYDKGEIIGTQTFGKGIVQTIRPLTDGSAIKYTIAKYFSGKDQDIHGKGVTPDQVVEAGEDKNTDLQYNAAVRYLKTQMK